MRNEKTQGEERMTSLWIALWLAQPLTVVQRSRNSPENKPRDTLTQPSHQKTPSCLFVCFAISKILLKLYGNFFNINRITNCISVLKERQWHIGVWSLYRFIVLYHAILKSPQSLQRLRDIFMYTSTAEGKFLTYQIGSFQIISQQS